MSSDIPHPGHTSQDPLGPDTKREEEQDPYDPFKVPPNIQEAKDYAKSKKVGFYKFDKNKEQKLDPYSGLPEEVIEYPICIDNMELSDLGAGFPVYFGFVTYAAILLGILLVVVGIYNIYTNRQGTTCELLGSSCSGTFAMKVSWPNKLIEYNQGAMGGLNLLFVVVGIFSLYRFRRWVISAESKCDRENITPPDFTILVRDLPLQETKQKVADFFRAKGKDGGGVCEVEKVLLIYKLEEFITKLTKKRKLELRNAKHPDESLQKDIDNLDNEIQETIKRAKEDNPDGLTFTGMALVTFKKEKDASLVLQKWNLGRAEKFFYRILGACGCYTPRKTYNGTVITVERAPEPAEIFWENYGFTFGELFQRRFGTLIYSTILIGASFGAIIGIKAAQDSAIKNGSNAGANQFLSFLCSFLINFINALIGFSIRKFGGREKHETYTWFYTSVAKRLSWAFFLNTAIITLLVHVIIKKSLDSMWAKGSIVDDVFFLFILNSVLSPLMHWANPVYLIRMYQRRKLESDGPNSKLTQYQANAIFEGPVFDMAQRYAAIQKTLLFTAFYSNLVPIGIPMSLVSVIVIYWVDKSLLLRRYSRPLPLGAHIVEEMCDTVELVFIAFSAGNLIWEDHLAPSRLAWNWICLIVSIINYILPSGSITHSCCEPPDVVMGKTGQVEYSKHRLNFLSEYDRSCPLTEDAANDEFAAFFEATLSPEQKNELQNAKATNPYMKAGTGINMPMMGGQQQFRPQMMMMNQRMQGNPFQMQMGGGMMMSGPMQGFGFRPPQMMMRGPMMMQPNPGMRQPYGQAMPINMQPQIRIQPQPMMQPPLQQQMNVSMQTVQQSTQFQPQVIVQPQQQINLQSSTQLQSGTYQNIQTQQVPIQQNQFQQNQFQQSQMMQSNRQQPYQQPQQQFQQQQPNFIQQSGFQQPQQQFQQQPNYMQQQPGFQQQGFQQQGFQMQQQPNRNAGNPFANQGNKFF